MKNIKTFNQLFENSVHLSSSNYWFFSAIFLTSPGMGELSSIARFLVSGDSTKEITSKFLEDLLPQYLGFSSLYTLSSDIEPPSIHESRKFDEWIHDNINEISNRAGLDAIYVHGTEIYEMGNLFGGDLSDFLEAFDGEETPHRPHKKYTEMYGDPNSIAWLIMDYLIRAGRNDILVDIFEFFDSKVGDPIGKNNHMLTIGEKYKDIITEIFNSDNSDWIYEYFKKNPLELHIIHDKNIKEKIILKTGIKDFSKLGGGLKSGLI